MATLSRPSFPAEVRSPSRWRRAAALLSPPALPRLLLRLFLGFLIIPLRLWALVDHPFAQRMWDGCACVVFWLGIGLAVGIPLYQHRIIDADRAFLGAFGLGPMMAFVTLCWRGIRRDLAFWEMFAAFLGVLLAEGILGAFLWIAREAW